MRLRRSSLVHIEPPRFTPSSYQGAPASVNSLYIKKSFTLMVPVSYYDSMTELIKRFPKDQFRELIASGMTEPQALAHVNFPRPLYIQLLVRDPEYREQVDEAKRARADVWHEKIVQSVDEPIEKDEVPAEKLRYEKLKYLAETDNPDKYGQKLKHQHDVNINIFQEMKDLPAAEARRILQSVDPFTVEAEIVPLEDIENDSLEDVL